MEKPKVEVKALGPWKDRRLVAVGVLFFLPFKMWRWGRWGGMASDNCEKQMFSVGPIAFRAAWLVEEGIAWEFKMPPASVWQVTSTRTVDPSK